MKDENKAAMLPISTLRGCSDYTLRSVIVESEKAIFDIRQQNARMGGQWPASKPHLIKAHRKQIARCQTLLRESA